MKCPKQSEYLEFVLKRRIHMLNASVYPRNYNAGHSSSQAFHIWLLIMIHD